MSIPGLRAALLCAGLACLLPATAHAAGWPRLEGPRSPACRDAFALAEATFHASHPRLYAPLGGLPPSVRSTLALQPEALDLSGGNALIADTTVFDKLPVPRGAEPPRSVYWQKAAVQGLRLAVAERAMGPRGDTYSVFVLPESVLAPAFVSAWSSAPATPQPQAPLIADGWLPPLVLREPEGGVWLVDMGQPFVHLADWQVHAVGSGGVRRLCTVRFRLAGDDALQLLPPAVRELGRLLQATIGSGTGEGTLQPSARIRNDVAHAWANAAMRPWAIGSASNTRAEVDAGLSRWAARDAASRARHQAVLKQLPLARRALAEHYLRQFPRTPAAAATLADFALDVALRTHYVFASDDPDKDQRDANLRPNPWGDR
jgi:hypothetical protein